MKLGKEFAVGAVVGAACGIAGVIKVVWDSGQWHDIRLWAANKLVWKICGKDYYLRDRRFDDMDIVHNKRADYKVWPKENPSHDSCATYEPYKSDDKTFAVMDICGVEGLYCGEHDTLENKFDEICDNFVNGIHNDAGAITEDQFIIEGRPFYVYYLRGGKDDDPGAICTVEKGPVEVNYCGVFISKKPLDIFNDKNYYELNDDDWGFTDEWMWVRDFAFDEGWRQR